MFVCAAIQVQIILVDDLKSNASNALTAHRGIVMFDKETPLKMQFEAIK